MEFIQGMHSYIHDLLHPTPSDPTTEYITLLPRFLPPSLATTAIQVFTSIFGVAHALQTFLTPQLAKFVAQPDVFSILALLAIFFISLKIVGMMYRWVMFWVTMVLQLVMWAAMVGVGLWVWNRGVDGFLGDVKDLGMYWLGEYEKFAGEAKGWKDAHEEQIRFQAGKQDARGAGAWRPW
jgi:hypothetical protein